MDEFADIDTPADESLLFGGAMEDTDEPTEEVVAEEKEVVADEIKEEEERPQRNQTIPRDRFDEVNNKFKLAREENERLLLRLQELDRPAVANTERVASLREMEKEYLAMVMDGEEEKALDIREKINAETIRIAEESAEQKVSAREQAKITLEQENRFDATVAALTVEFPALDINGDGADADLIDAVVGLRDIYISRGMASHEALDKAARKIMDKGHVSVDTRKEEAVRRGADTANRQPPRPVGVGDRNVSTSIIPDKQEDWESLPGKERERLLA